jgi:transcriptional regulator with XRE-family HTH domain
MRDQGTARGLAFELSALGAAVRETRARRGLSQEDLGFAAGLHRNYVGAVERGEINATFRTLMRLCAGLRMSVSELILLYERNVGEDD